MADKVVHDVVYCDRYQLVCRPELHPKRCIIFIDYDDTILATTWLSSWIGSLVSSEIDPPRNIRDSLDRLGIEMTVILEALLALGSVYLVTASEVGWVQATSVKHMMAIVPSLLKTKIISARTLYETEYPNDIMAWKYNTYMEVFKTQCTADNSPLNVIAIGDSESDMLSAQAAVEQASKDYPVTVAIKAINLVDKPLASHLHQEVEKLGDIIPQLMEDCNDVVWKMCVTHE